MNMTVMTKSLRLVGVLLAALSLSACASYVIQSEIPTGVGPHEEGMSSFAGRAGAGSHDMEFVTSERCKDKDLDRVEVQRNFGQGLISWLTFNLYNPVTVVYRCAPQSDPDDG